MVRGLWGAIASGFWSERLLSSRKSRESEILVHHSGCGLSILIKQHGQLTFVKIRSLKDNCGIVSFEAFGKNVCLPYSSTVFVYNRAMLINVVYSSFWKFFRWLHDHNRWVNSSKNVHAAINCTRHHRVLAQPWLSGSGKVQLGFQTWIQNHGLPDSGFRHWWDPRDEPNGKMNYHKSTSKEFTYERWVEIGK